MAYVIIQQGNAGTELVLKGVIAGSISGSLIPLVEDNLREGITRVIIDLDESQLLTSDVLNNICLLQKILDQKGIPVVLTDVCGVNKRIYERLHLHKIIPIVDH
jgi:hypothetical protein